VSSVPRLDARALTGVTVALLTWSSAYAAIAYALPAFSPGELALARLLVGSLCFAGLLRWRGETLPAWHDWPRIALLGVLGLTTYHLCLNWAETRIASGTAAIVIALVPAATAAVAAVWMRERLAVRVWAGLAVALVGTVLVVLESGQKVDLDPRALLVLVCVVVTAIFFVGEKPLFERHGTLPVTAAAFFAATLAAVPFGWHLPAAFAHAGWREITAVLWLGIGPMFLGYLGWNYAVHRATASRVASFIYLSPPIALLIGWLWLHEVPEVLVLVGGAITIGGVVLANARRRPAPPAASPALPVSSCEQS